MIYLFFFLIFTIGLSIIVASSYFDHSLVIEVLHYYIEIKVEILFFIAIFCLFLILILIHCIFYCYKIIRQIKLRSREKNFILLSEAYMLMELNDLTNSQILINKLQKATALELNEPFLLLNGIINFQLKQYKVSKKYFLQLNSLNKKLSELFICKLIAYTLFQEKNLQMQISVLEDLTIIFQQQYWIKILHVEVFRLKKNWETAIKNLKELKHCIKYPTLQKSIIFHYALAHQLYENEQYNEALKILSNSPDNKQLFMILLHAKLYCKINKLKKSLSILEEAYKISPHVEIAKLFLCINKNYVDQNKLCDLSPNYYFSIYMKSDREIMTGNYDTAEDILKSAVEKFSYSCFHHLILKLQIFSRRNYNDLLKSMEKCILKEFIDPFWQCTNCHNPKKSWWYECDACNSFNTIQWIIP